MADGSAIMIAKVNLIRYHLSVESSNLFDSFINIQLNQTCMKLNAVVLTVY